MHKKRYIQGRVDGLDTAGPRVRSHNNPLFINHLNLKFTF